MKINEPTTQNALKVIARYDEIVRENGTERPVVRATDYEIYTEVVETMQDLMDEFTREEYEENEMAWARLFRPLVRGYLESLASELIWRKVDDAWMNERNVT